MQEPYSRSRNLVEFRRPTHCRPPRRNQYTPSLSDLNKLRIMLTCSCGSWIMAASCLSLSSRMPSRAWYRLLSTSSSLATTSAPSSAPLLPLVGLPPLALLPLSTLVLARLLRVATTSTSRLGCTSSTSQSIYRWSRRSYICRLG